MEEKEKLLELIKNIDDEWLIAYFYAFIAEYMK